ncbi:MAG: hypothetical protein N2438_09610 [Limisphaera sp.]|nr:hypothetical protein [Limisphaera sp.]
MALDPNRQWLGRAGPRPLTPLRAGLALLVALAADFVQIGLGPLGVTGLDDVLDLVVAALEIGLLGFHPLLLPTFVLEVLPIVEFMPTWTACVLAVMLRRPRAPRPPGGATREPHSAAGESRGPVIDV